MWIFCSSAPYFHLGYFLMCLFELSDNKRLIHDIQWL
uniref:Uncharacterized protein n=1 Tax=Setaria viridis TaxID=4556 RepID=A0A4U6VJL7_SETVI|nr:hypothetical protein SEVIR_3G422250v2 [Setaria viridis]